MSWFGLFGLWVSGDAAGESEELEVKYAEVSENAVEETERIPTPVFEEVDSGEDSDLVSTVEYFLPPIYSTVKKPPPLPPPDWPVDGETESGPPSQVKVQDADRRGPALVIVHESSDETDSELVTVQVHESTDETDSELVAVQVHEVKCAQAPAELREPEKVKVPREDSSSEDEPRVSPNGAKSALKESDGGTDCERTSARVTFRESPQQTIQPSDHIPDFSRATIKLKKKVKRVWGSVNELRGVPAAKSFVKRVLPQKQYHFEKGQSGFEDLRRHIKNGGDFCKELASVLQERSEAEAAFSKTLGKLSAKLLKSTREVYSGSANNGATLSSSSSSGANNGFDPSSIYGVWARIGLEMEAESEIHRNFATAVLEQVVKPLKQLVDSQHRIRKSVETTVDKSCKSLSEWRVAEGKAKKASFLCARENEKLRDPVLVNSSEENRRLSSVSSLHISTPGPKLSPAPASNDKLEGKRKKAEESVKKADLEYYSVCLRAERSRLEWASAVIRGSHCFQVMEEERLKALKDLAGAFIAGFSLTPPKLAQLTVRMKEPFNEADLTQDFQIVRSLRLATEPIDEQILPDFYPEQVTLAMNRDRRKQALIKLLQIIRADLERERRGKAGVESLAQALKQTPNFSNEDSQQNVLYKLHHMRSMLTYLEATRYKLQSALADLEGASRTDHPLAGHLHLTKDRFGYAQTLLRVPPWVHSDSDPPTDWTGDRGTADGTSVQPDSDLDEFSSQESSERDFAPTQISSNSLPLTATAPPAQCRALYSYSANLYDELSLTPGDVINIHDKQPDGWWLGELNGTVGIFPATYVEEIN